MKFFSAALLFLAHVTRAEQVSFEWNLDAILDSNLSPDCMNLAKQGRYVYLAEESLPGPIIDVNEGDEVTVSRELIACFELGKKVTN